MDEGGEIVELGWGVDGGVWGVIKLEVGGELGKEDGDCDGYCGGDGEVGK